MRLAQKRRFTLQAALRVGSQGYDLLHHELGLGAKQADRFDDKRGRTASRCADTMLGAQGCFVAPSFWPTYKTHWLFLRHWLILGHATSGTLTIPFRSVLGLQSGAIKAKCQHGVGQALMLNTDILTSSPIMANAGSRWNMRELE